MYRFEKYREPLPVVVEVDEEAMDSYASIILSLEKGGFTEDMNTLWTTLPVDGIRLMVNVWLTRPMDRAGITHPIPTSAQALQIIESDPRFSSLEKEISFLSRSTWKQVFHYLIWRINELMSDLESGDCIITYIIIVI